MKRIIENILKVLVILLIVAWVVIVFIDFFRTTENKNPKFCIKTQVKNYPDGTTFECIGLGYEMYRYNRVCGSVRFGPFFIKEYLTKEELCQENK